MLIQADIAFAVYHRTDETKLFSRIKKMSLPARWFGYVQVL